MEIHLVVKWLAFLFFLVTGCLCAFGAADRRLAFERGEAVYVSNLDGTAVRRLADGVLPAISPDASRVAFSTVEKSATRYVRHLGVVEVTSGRVTALNNIPGDNCYQACWSPSSRVIAFISSTNGITQLATVLADGTGFRLIPAKVPAGKSVYSPCWARDGLSIFCQDTTILYRLALDGSILAQWNIARIVPNGSMSADNRIDVSPDGGRLLLSIDMDEDYTRTDWDGPVPALWSFDLLTQTAVRLTSSDLFAWDGCWLAAANFLFATQRARQKQVSIYRTNGNDQKLLIEDGRRPSTGAP